jgi:hypothetical protein
MGLSFFFMDLKSRPVAQHGGMSQSAAMTLLPRFDATAGLIGEKIKRSFGVGFFDAAITVLALFWTGKSMYLLVHRDASFLVWGVSFSCAENKREFAGRTKFLVEKGEKRWIC